MKNSEEILGFLLP